MKRKQVLRKFLSKIYRFIIKKEDPRSDLLELMPKNSICVEIGVWKGALSKKVLKIVQPKEFHLIDPWLFQPEFKERWYGGALAEDQKDMDKIYSYVLNKFKKYKNIIIHRDYSEKISEKFQNNYFDWIYLDGNHHYEFVKKDIELYLPKLKKGGYLIGDDYLWGKQYSYPVKKALNEFLDKKLIKKVIIKDSFFIFLKNE